MRLAREQKLQRLFAAEQLHGALGPQRQQVQPLVRRQPTGEADGETVGGETVLGCFHIGDVLAPTEAVAGGAGANHVDQPSPCLGARSPEVRVRDVLDRRPGRGVVGSRKPAIAEVAVE